MASSNCPQIDSLWHHVTQICLPIGNKTIVVWIFHHKKVDVHFVQNDTVLLAYIHEYMAPTGKCTTRTCTLHVGCTSLLHRILFCGSWPAPNVLEYFSLCWQFAKPAPDVLFCAQNSLFAWKISGRIQGALWKLKERMYCENWV